MSKLQENAVKLISYANLGNLDLIPKYLRKKKIVEEADRILKDIKTKGEWK